MNERGTIPYGSVDRLEQSCYRELQNADILVSIVGGRFGSGSDMQPYSISQQELKTAHELGRQIYVFVEATVLGEYRTYVKNKDLPGFQCIYVDDCRIYEFIGEVERYPVNNTMVPFSSTREITDFLREQWAGLFQRYLQEQSRTKEIRIIQQLQETAQALDKLVAYLADQNKNTGEIFQDILLSNHPAFKRLKLLTQTPYRVFFTNIAELETWLVARSWTRDDAPFEPPYSWTTKPDKDGRCKRIVVQTEVFNEDGKLRAFRPEEWNEDWINEEIVDILDETITDDDVPF